MSISKTSIVHKFQRIHGDELIVSDISITADNETVILNVFKFRGSLQIISQFAEITEVTALTNMTNVFADIWDGTNSVPLTDDGITLSNAPVGTLFTKNQTADQTYNLLTSTQVRLLEVNADEIGLPFIITGKNGVDNYIRFCFTTNAVLNFKMSIWFRYRSINGAYLILA